MEIAEGVRMGNQINCPECMTMRGDTVAMRAEDQGWFKCPVCGGEYWPQNDELVVKWIRKEKQEAAAGYISLSQQPGVKVKGGGDPSGKSPTAGNKKPTQKLYNQLFKQT